MASTLRSLWHDRDGRATLTASAPALRLGAGLPFTLGDDPTQMVRAHTGIAFDIGRR